MIRLNSSLRLASRRPRFINSSRFQFSTSFRVQNERPPRNPEDEFTDKFNYNPEVSFSESANPEHFHYPTVTANDLECREVPPTEVRMLVRDFIEDSLYNPNYGYFPRQAVILDPPSAGFDFPSLRNVVDFEQKVSEKYFSYGYDTSGPGRQIWHTPTELFKPWYGQAIAKCLISEYLLKYFPYEDFVIYEIGAGNGTLASNILDYIRDNHPDVYDRTRYNIVEISGRLVEVQKERLSASHPCVRVNHQSVFHWNKREPAPCFFIAMEVIDNFAHDVIRYDLRTLEPYQGWIAVDRNGDFSTHYTRVTDPLIASFLDMRGRLKHPPPIKPVFQKFPSLRKAYASMPLAPNLSQEEYIPTRLLSMLLTLREYFPRHRLLLSDFFSLPDTIPGHNAPVVQTRFRNTTVPCTTLTVKQGYFDIFFPTNFERLRDIGLPVGERKSSVFTHAEFLQTYADLANTRLKNGENPMLEYYQNVKVLF
ncbi:DUF185-domain-containing protein [Gloeophyllum trabeum ATCC 11539]|uniref:Protein arginine methyltransferase NDUFAF7 n=1 Tax=Gloeophyllum trabeum (strain ATCC 11539 / FP-39264 / Madison 617) TaxID=670483 RepID=S7Q9L5_GLOTA|nr:DUF185-domain-containing protein [Gloeophyllum trabeum ATCC 11539]EPQ56616.1 DUF185-domain-containing protein [Gloeophyllum trabeum ATCC 11539]